MMKGYKSSACDAPADGVNYGVITCKACKVYLNAYQAMKSNCIESNLFHLKTLTNY